MPVRINDAIPQTMSKPPRMGAAATRYNVGAPITKNQAIKKEPVMRQRQVRSMPKEPKPARAISVTGFIIQKLLEQKSTYAEIIQEIAMKFDAQTAEVWKNRISIKRSDINAGRIARKQVEEMGVALPIPPLAREGKQLYAVERKPRQVKQVAPKSTPPRPSGATRLVQKTLPVAKKPAALITKTVAVKKIIPVTKKVVPVAKKK
jgi:hypothetical protein